MNKILNFLNIFLSNHFGFGLYGLVRLKIGIRAVAHMTFKCNYNCKYCAVEMPQGSSLHSEDKTLHEWIDYIEKFSRMLFGRQMFKEICPCGGEPTLNPALPDFINYLTGKGIFVTLYTNLSRPNVIEKIKPTYKFRIISTYHHGQTTKERFNSAYLRLYKKYRIEVDEIDVPWYGEPKQLKYSILKYFETEETLDNPIHKKLRISPDQLIFPTCFRVYNYPYYKSQK